MSWIDSCGKVLHMTVRNALWDPFRNRAPDEGTVMNAKVILHDLITICGLAAIAGAVLGVGSIVGGVICGVGMVLLHQVTQNSMKHGCKGRVKAVSLVSIGSYSLFYIPVRLSVD